MRRASAAGACLASTGSAAAALAAAAAASVMAARWAPLRAGARLSACGRGAREGSRRPSGALELESGSCKRAGGSRRHPGAADATLKPASRARNAQNGAGGGQEDGQPAGRLRDATPAAFPQPGSAGFDVFLLRIEITPSRGQGLELTPRAARARGANPASLRPSARLMSLWQPQPITRAARGLVVPLAARGGERRPGGGGGGAGGHSSRRAAPPQRLLSRTEPDPDRKETVYTLRLATAPARGSALTDPAAGVVVCLVGRDGAALLHRVARLNDPETTEQVGGWPRRGRPGCAGAAGGAGGRGPAPAAPDSARSAGGRARVRCRRPPPPAAAASHACCTITSRGACSDDLISPAGGAGHLLLDRRARGGCRLRAGHAPRRRAARGGRRRAPALPGASAPLAAPLAGGRAAESLPAAQRRPLP